MDVEEVAALFPVIVERDSANEFRLRILPEDFDLVVLGESAEQKGDVESDRWGGRKRGVVNKGEKKETRNSRLIFPMNILVFVSSFTALLLLIGGAFLSVVLLCYHI